MTQHNLSILAKERRFAAEKIAKRALGKAQAWPQWKGPMDLEIGSGAGLHAIQRAKSNPHRALLAIERTRTKFLKMRGRHEGHPLIKNLFPIHAEASIWLPLMAPKGELFDSIFILYPNPYPKPKHRNLRWAFSPFLGDLVQRLKDQGEIIFATNEVFYRDELIRRLPLLHPELVLSQNEILRDPSRSRTHFERKYLLRNQPCFSLVFRKDSSQDKGLECR